MKKHVICVAAVAAMIMLAAIPAFSQSEDTKPVKEEGPSQIPPSLAQAAPTPETAKAAELSIYGEVQAVNTAASSMNVQYYDYDNDEEKSVEVIVDKDTKLENANAIAEIKKGDWVDVTYTTVAGKSTAKTVSVEQEEPAADETTPADDE